MKTESGLVAVAGLVALAAACTSSGAGGREVQITQKDDGCTPASVSVTAGEKLKLVVKNESSKDYEIEGIEGANLEEVVVPEGRTRTPGYTVPAGAGVHKLKCYVPGGVATIIELTAGEASGGTPAPQPSNPAGQTGASSNAPAGTTVTVRLSDFVVTPDTTSVKAGPVHFVVSNTSTDSVHEMAVLRSKSSTSFENMGEVEVMPPGVSGAITLDLSPGTYRLACLVAKGEQGSVVDHYQQGMYTDITVN